MDCLGALSTLLGLQVQCLRHGDILGPAGKLDKLTPELEADIKEYINQSITDKTISIAEIMRKYHLSRNTVSKYIQVLQKAEEP